VSGIDFDSPDWLRSRSAAEIEDAVPSGWRIGFTRNGLGGRLADPCRSGDRKRIMGGNPADPEARTVYSISRSGKVSNLTAAW
jgi:hypothetical protein